VKDRIANTAPTRAESHVAETASFKRLERAIPDHWIVRYASERDYGVDCLIEPVTKPGGPVTGDLLAIQMKSIDEIAWNGTGDDAEATFSGTKVETVSYWMGLPVPVFLCVHDRLADEVVYARVKRQVRHRYLEVGKQETFGFRLSRKFILDLATDRGKITFLVSFLQERAQPAFARALTELLVQREVFARYIQHHLDRDSFMEVETEELARLSHFYQTIRIVAEFSGIEWTIPSIEHFIHEDQKLFKHEWMHIHERTQDSILRALTPIFLQVLRKGSEIVGKQEIHYWYAHDPILAHYVDELILNPWMMDSIEKGLAHVVP
jgi:hypothetical protein